MSESFPAAALECLAQRVSEGDVVFFIGAGFSTDTEGNTATRMILRLLARLWALDTALKKRLLMGREGWEGKYERFHSDLITTFDLQRFGKAGPRLKQSGGFWKLTDKYYETNEWFCNAFGRMLRLAANRSDVAELIAETTRMEKALLKKPKCLVPDEPNPLKPDSPFVLDPDPTPPEPIPRELFTLLADQTSDGPPTPAFQRLAGKALFLDTLGFRQPQVMAGNPTNLDLSVVADSFARRLLPRHHVIARLAREGLCTTTLTTNFDLLLEGAYRLAGFDYRADNVTQPTRGADALPRTTFSNFARLASPRQFFTDGKAHRTAVLVKMHGCTDAYRTCDYQYLLNDPRPERDTHLKNHLMPLVFTYREIQNWRTDSWAADYLRTLQRTRVVVFCGYSVQDPVIHDTFRTVYEEMERAGKLHSPDTGKEIPPHNAPAFFFAYGGSQRREFYGQEVLRAAGRAVHAPEGGSPHPNTIGFFKRRSQRFPDLDETLQWLFHLTFRQRQQESLDSDLRRISTLLLGRAVPECELECVRGEFKSLVEAEKREAAGAAFNRRRLRTICAWSECFHPGLLREFAAADTLQRRRGPGPELALLRRHPWYYPASQDTSWTAWGAVVEVALRRMAAHQFSTVTALSEVDGSLRPAACLAPTVLHHPPRNYRTPGAKPELGAPHALTILFAGFRRVGALPDIPGRPTRRSHWELEREDAPWPRAGKSAMQPTARGRHRKRRAPDAHWMWRWAIGPDGNEFSELLAANPFQTS